MKTKSHLFSINKNPLWDKIFATYQNKINRPAAREKLLSQLHEFSENLSDRRADLKLKINTLILTASVEHKMGNLAEARGDYLLAHDLLFPAGRGKLTPALAGQDRVLFGVYRSMAIINLHENEHQKAFDCLELAQACDPKHPSTMMLRATLAHHSDDHEQCVEFGAQALKLDKGAKQLTPDERVVLNYLLANAYNEKGFGARAFACLEAATKISPTNPELKKHNSAIRKALLKQNLVSGAQKALTDLMDFVHDNARQPQLTYYNISPTLKDFGAVRIR